MLPGRKILLSLLIATALHAGLLIWPQRLPAWPVQAHQSMPLQLTKAPVQSAPSIEEKAIVAEHNEAPSTETRPSNLVASAIAASGETYASPASKIYLSSGEVDESPRPLQPIVVQGPDEPLGKAEGYVHLELWIDNQGRVNKLEALESNVPPAFATVAMETFQRARFMPGLKDAQPIATRLRIEVRFYETIGKE